MLRRVNAYGVRVQPSIWSATSSLSTLKQSIRDPSITIMKRYASSDASIHSQAKGVAAETYDNQGAVHDSVKTYYGKVLSKSSDLKTSACTAQGSPPATVLNALVNVPTIVKERFYGCGNPIPDGIEGLTVLDLGCGTGRDVFVAAQFVGPKGTVIGLDMTDEQINTARECEIEFRQTTAGKNSGKCVWKTGYIERIIASGVPKSSCNLCISNCVVNLSPDKPAVLQGVYDALAPGGEFYFSDVYVDRRLPADVRSHEVLFGECLAGALYTRDFDKIAHSVGFAPPRILHRSPIHVYDHKLRQILGNANFESITYRLFKSPNKEDAQSAHDNHEEDYGQYVTYNGGIPGNPLSYQFDHKFVFELNRPRSVDGNTALALSAPSWLGKYFSVSPKKQHFGAFKDGFFFGDSSSNARSQVQLPQNPTMPLSEEAAACDTGS